jgi:hypothetical protein
MPIEGLAATAFGQAGRVRLIAVEARRRIGWSLPGVDVGGPKPPARKLMGRSHVKLEAFFLDDLVIFKPEQA